MIWVSCSWLVFPPDGCTFLHTDYNMDLHVSLHTFIPINNITTTSISCNALNYWLGFQISLLRFVWIDEGYLIRSWWAYLCSMLSIAHQCPLLANPPQHGQMNCSHIYSPFSYGSHCDFECNEGFWMRGKSAMECNSSGHWTQDLPTCHCESPAFTLHPIPHCSGIQTPDLMSFPHLSRTMRGYSVYVLTPISELLPSSGKLQPWFPVYFHL